MRRRRAARAAVGSLLGVAGAAALGACAPGEPALGAVSEAILGGVETSGDPAVVMTQSTSGSCTGTLVAPRVVLTAAHCIQPSIDAGQTAVGVVRFGSGPGAWIADVGIRDMITHRRYDNDAFTGFDIGLIRLAGDAPADIAPVPYHRDPIDDDFLGAPLRVVGFGVTDGETQTGGGTKRRVDLTVDEITQHHIGIGTATRNICQGDSGGPSIASVGGVDTVVAVSSFGSNFCQDRSYVTRTDAFAGELLDEVVAAWSGPCQHDGTCVTEGCGDYPDPDCDVCGLDGVCGSGCARIDLDCPVGGSAGDPCDAADDCESRLCVEALDDPRIAYCSSECDPDAAQPCQLPLGLCVAGDDGVHRCYVDGITPGALGAPCAGGDDCRSGACDPAHGICVEPCGADEPACPAPYECVDLGSIDACTLADDGGCGGCAAGGSGAAGGFFLTLLTLVGLRARRRGRID